MENKEFDSKLAALTQTAKKTGRVSLRDKHETGQLMLWQEYERAIPNTLARCSLFSVRNRSEKRTSFLASSKLEIPIGDKGKLSYNGEELRQDEETVWLQLVHISKQAKSNTFSIVPYTFLKSINWDTNGKSYTRLTQCLSRLASANIEVYNASTKWTQNTRLLALYGFNEAIDKDVQIKLYDDEDDLMFLFSQNMYSKINWEMRLKLPVGIATWLHSFYATHREPFELSVEYLAAHAGLKLSDSQDSKLSPLEKQRARKRRIYEAKRNIEKALQNLVSVGFLKAFQITENFKVVVERA